MRLLTMLTQVGLLLGIVWAVARLILDEINDRRFWREQHRKMNGHSVWRP